MLDIYDVDLNDKWSLQRYAKFCNQNGRDTNYFYNTAIFVKDEKLIVKNWTKRFKRIWNAKKDLRKKIADYESRGYICVYQSNEITV